MSKYTTISKDGISYLCSCVNKLANVSEGVDDLNLRSDGTFSSVKIDALLNTLKTDCNEYTDRLVANLSRLELKIANDESEITQPNIMYLYKPSGSTSYEQYVVVGGVKVLLGTTDIKMSDYYTITQADAKFVLKTDFDSLKTKVTTHTDDTDIHVTSAERTKWDKVTDKVDKTDIVDNLTSTHIDKPLSANQGKVLKDEVDLKANDSDVVKKTDIVTTIDSTSTDTQVPSAKAVYDECKQGRLINQSVIDTYGTEILKYPLGKWYISQTSLAYKFTDLPIKEAGTIEISTINTTPNQNPWNCGWTYRTYKYIKASATSVYTRSLNSRDTPGRIKNDTGWQIVCTTKVADIPKTNIAPANTTTFVNFKGNSMCNYCVENGVCYVSLWAIQVSTIGENNTGVILPKPKSGFFGGGFLTGGGNSEQHAYAHTVPETGELKINVKDANISLFGAFSYPVAES